MDRATSPTTREVDERLSEVVPLINTAKVDDLTDGDQDDTKSIIGGEAIPVKNLHLEHVSHGRPDIESELFVPDRRKSVADNLGLADVALTKVADRGKEIGCLVHDTELSERIALATSISRGKPAGFDDTDSDTAHSDLLYLTTQKKHKEKKEKDYLGV